MSKAKPGTEVGVIAYEDAENEAVYFIGYGTYEGETTV